MSGFVIFLVFGNKMINWNGNFQMWLTTTSNLTQISTIRDTDVGLISNDQRISRRWFLKGCDCGMKTEPQNSCCVHQTVHVLNFNIFDRNKFQDLTITMLLWPKKQSTCNGSKVLRNWAGMIVAKTEQKLALRSFCVSGSGSANFANCHVSTNQVPNQFLKTISSLPPPPALIASPQPNAPCSTSRRNSLQTNQNGNSGQLLWGGPW